MKPSFIAICFGVLFFTGCKEVPPPINFGTAVNIDTTYMVTAPASVNAHNVLVEEFTGQSCGNCPAGHAILDTAQVHNPGRLNVIALFQNDGSPLTTPPTGAAYDFRSNIALQIGSSNIYNGVSQYPNAGIDRVPYPGSPGNIIGDPNWTGDITTLLPQVDSLNMTVSSAYTTSVAGITTATITTTVTYAQTMSTQQNLTIVVVADSMVDIQEFPFGTDTPDYVFNDVFVGMVTTVPYGDPLIDTISVKAPGRFVQSVYTYALPASFAKGAINPAHCRVIAFVNATGAGGNYQVYQSVQTPLGP